MTTRNAKFIEAFLKTRDATKAAIEAGYSPNSASVTGCKLLKNAKVRAEIDKKQSILCEMQEISPKTVTAELARIAFFDPRNLFDEFGNFLNISAWPPELTRAISSIDIQVNARGDTVKKVRFWDKVRAREMLGKILKMFDEKPPTNDGPPKVIREQAYTDSEWEERFGKRHE